MKILNTLLLELSTHQKTMRWHPSANAYNSVVHLIAGRRLSRVKYAKVGISARKYCSMLAKSSVTSM